MDAKRMDTKEKEFYCNMYQKIEPDEKVVEQLLQIEVNSEMRRKRMIKKFRVAVACLAKTIRILACGMRSHLHDLLRFRRLSRRL